MLRGDCLGPLAMDGRVKDVCDCGGGGVIIGESVSGLGIMRLFGLFPRFIIIGASFLGGASELGPGIPGTNGINFPPCRICDA